MSLSHQQKQASIGQWFYQSFLALAIYPSLWTAASLASLTYFVQEALDLPPDWRAVALIFAAALLPYNWTLDKEPRNLRKYYANAIGDNSSSISARRKAEKSLGQRVTE